MVMIWLPNSRLRTLYHFLQFHDGETLLLKDICEEVTSSEKTVRKNIKWLISHNLIKKTGKRYFLIDQF